MKSKFGPYEIGAYVVGNRAWSLHRGTDSARARQVWVRRVMTAPRRPNEARSIVKKVASCDRLVAPVALAADGNALVVIDAQEAGRTVLAEATQCAGQALIQFAHDLAVAVDALHAAGYAHGAIDEWAVDVDDHGHAWLRGMAQCVGELDRFNARRDMREVAAAIDRAGGGACDARIADTVAALAAGRARLGSLIACTAAILPSADGSVDGAEPTRKSPTPSGSATATAAARRARRTATARDGARQRRHAAAQRVRWGRGIVGAALCALLAVGVGVLWKVGGLPEASDRDAAAVSTARVSPAPELPSDPVDWASYLPALYDTRAEAFSAGDTEMLRQVFTSGSAQLRSDAETIAALVSQDRKVQGFAPTIVEVIDVSVDNTHAVAVVRDELPDFVITDSDGAELPVTGRATATTTLNLDFVDGAWLIDKAWRNP